MNKKEIENEINQIQKKLFILKQATKIDTLSGVDGCYYEDLEQEIKLTIRLVFLKEQLSMFK